MKRTALGRLFGLVALLWVVGGDIALRAQGAPGLRSYYLLGANSANATVVSGCRPVDLYSADLFTIDATPVYVRLYNLCRAPTATDTPVLVLMIPGAATGGQTSYRPAAPLHLSTGLAFRTTTGIAVTDDTAVSATEVIVNLSYVTP